MKKRLAKWFLLVAKRLDPATHVENVQYVEDYEARKIGLTYIVMKKDIKVNRTKDGAQMSFRESRRCLLNEVRKKIRMYIIGVIDSRRLVEYSTEEVDGDIKVSGEIKVYVPKKDEQ